MRLTATISKALIVTIAVSTTLPAQVTWKNTGYELRDALADVAHIWVSPFRSEKRDWIGVIGVAAGTAALLPVDDQIDAWIVRHPNAAIVKAGTPWNEDHPELGDLSTGQRLLPISGALIVSGMVSDNRKLREAGWGCLSAWQASSTIRQVLYATVSRERPSVAEGDQYAITTPGGEWDFHSFPAGHTMNAVACTTFWNSRFHMGVLEPVLALTAAGITASRMTDRRHWATDTWIGIAGGYAIGRSVAARYARREAEREEKKASEPVRAAFRQALLDGLQISPARGGGVIVGWAGKF